MSTPRGAVDVELLLAQRAWVQRLAERLVADPAGADDAAQDALVAALRRPPRGAASERTLRAWLARVLRNRVRLGARGEARRRARESAAARPERTDSVAEVVARAQDLRALVEAVLALDEPYRTAVLLAHFDGLSVAASARRTGASPVAVRKRLSRGVATLRARLERRWGDGASLALALAGIVGPNAGGALSRLARWGTLMSWSGKAAVGAAVVVGLVAFVVGNRERAPALRPPGAESAADAGAAASGAAASGADEEAAATQRADVAQLAPAGALVVRVRDAAGAPLADADVLAADVLDARELEDALAAQWAALGIAERAPRWLALVEERAIPGDPHMPDRRPLVAGSERALGRTGADGVARVTPVASGEALVVRHSGAFPMVVPPAAALGASELEVVLPPRGTATISVVDPAGRPIAGAFARVELDFASLDPADPRPLWDPLVWHGPTGATGALVVDVPAGVDLRATPFGDFSGRDGGLWVDPARGEGACELFVWALGALRGVAVWEDGTPAGGLTVRYDPPWSLVWKLIGTIETDAAGAFELRDQVVGLGRLTLGPSSRFARPLVELEVEVRAGDTSDVGTIELARGALVSGRVAAPFALDGARVQLEMRSGGTTHWAGAVDGEGRFAGRAPRGEVELAVSVVGGWRQREVLARTVPVPSEGVELQLGDVLGAVRIGAPEGMPDGVAVVARLFERGAPSGWALADAVTLDRQRVAADAVELAALAPATYDVEISFGDFGGARFEDVVVEAGRTTDLGRASLAGAELFGRVLDAAGAPVAGAKVVLLAPALDIFGTGAPLERRTTSDADGAYRLRGVVARSWRAYAATGDLASDVRQVALASGERRELDLALLPACYVRGRVTRRGEPEPAAGVGWSYADITDLKLSIGAPRWVRPDADGRYALGPFLAGGYRLRAGDAVRFVELEPGRDAHVDFEVESPATVLTLELGGEPLRHLEQVSATCVDPKSTSYGLRATGLLLGAGRVEMALPPATCVLEVHASEHGQRPRLHAVLDGAALGARATVALPDGVLELALGDGWRHREAPELFVLATSRADLRIAGRWQSPQPSERDGDVVRYLGIPAGALVRLEGTGPGGTRVERELTCGAGTMRFDWP